MTPSPYLEKQPSSIPKYLGFLLLMAFIFVLGWNVGSDHAAEVSKAKSGVYDETFNPSDNIDMQVFWDVWGLLSGKYVDLQAIDYQKMIYGAIHGMVASLEDPYTAYMTPKENKEFQDTLEGTLEGIGAELTLRKGLLTVVSPLKGSPAQRAGIQPEDIIVEIDGKPTTDFTLEQAVMNIRGKKGTKVVLTVLREGHKEPLKLSVTRDMINIESVRWKFQDKIALVELNQFGNHTNEEFSKAINEILKKRPEGMVLDLRYNGGGYLDGAVDIVSEFIQEGEVVTVKKRNPEENETIYVNGKGRVLNLPLVILINKGSASASEIVAGALQDHKRATIIGERSFGKGTVQEVDNLIDGSSLRVTIAKWFTPNDRDINTVGIEPDILIERTPEDFENGNDPQIKAATNYLLKKK